MRCLKDYCTAWFEGNWCECCKNHDAQYVPAIRQLIKTPWKPWKAARTKHKADNVLFTCVRPKAGIIMASGMWSAVMVFGWVPMYIDVIKHNIKK